MISMNIHLEKIGKYLRVAAELLFLWTTITQVTSTY